MSMDSVRQKADDLLKALGIEQPPVDVEAIAKALGFMVVPFEFPDNQSGVVFIEGETKAIGVNASHAPTRRRFTVAHELGHYLLGHEDYHAGTEFLRRQGAPKWADPAYRQEREADRFAAELLMPSKFLRADLSRPQNLKDLARRYQVSEQAMVIQITDLGLTDALILPE